MAENQTDNQAVSFAPQTVELLKAAKALGLPQGELQKIISAFANIDVAIKVSQATTELLIAYRGGTLTPMDFLNAILAIMQTDKQLIGAGPMAQTKIETMHKFFGIPMIQKAPKVKKPAAAAPAPAPAPPPPEPTGRRRGNK